MKDDLDIKITRDGEWVEITVNGRRKLRVEYDLFMAGDIRLWRRLKTFYKNQFFVDVDIAKLDVLLDVYERLGRSDVPD